MGFLRFLGFTLVRAGQGFWRNKMMSLAATATVILMLVLLSGLVIVLGGLNSGLAYIESKVGVTARLVDGLEPAAIDQLVAEVSALPGRGVGRVRVTRDGHAAPRGGVRRAGSDPGYGRGRDQPVQQYRGRPDRSNRSPIGRQRH